MKNFTFSNLVKHAFLLLVIGLSTTGLKAQLSGTFTVLIDYPSIDAFVSDLNTNGVGAGGVTLNVPAGYTETAPANGIQLTATGTASNPIIIQKNGAGANPILNAGIGTGTPGSAIQDGVFALIGSDYVTIDGIDIVDANTTNPATMEWGYGMFKANATDGCQNNIIRNCTVTLNIVNNATGTAPAFDGSRGINIVNSLITTQTTVVTITAASGSNSFNTITTNTIKNVNIGIALSGFAATAGVGPTPNAASFFGDMNNLIGGVAIVNGNIIQNFGGASAAANPSAGIRTVNQWSLGINYNTLNNNIGSGGGANHVNTLRGIFIGAATSANMDVTNNTLTLVSGAATSLLDGISSAAGSTTLANTVNILNNLVQLAYSTATTATINGIINSGTATTVNINGNTITNVISLPVLQNVLGGTGTLVMIEGGSPVNLNITNNFVSTLARTGLSGSWRGIKITSPTNTIISGNTIENLAYSVSTSTGSMDGIYGFSSSVNVTIANNVVRNLSTPTTGTINGIREFGINGIKLINNNQVYGFATTTGGAGGATFNGIFCSTGAVTISGNTIYSLISSGSTGGTVGAINGINIASSSAAWLISANKIHTLSTTSTSTTAGLVNGILASTGFGSITNNVVGGLNASASVGTDAVRGISLTSSTVASTINVNYNSVYLNATSSGVNFGTSGIFHTGSTTATTATLALQNNIIINESTANGTGLTVVFRRTTAASTNLALASNRNLLFAGLPSATSLIYTDGTAQQTLAGYVSTVLPAGHDVNSITGEGFTYSTPGSYFMSLSGASADFLRPVAGITTQTESGAANISGITTDYNAVIRAGNIGYAGTGSNPDMGAYEFEGISPAPVITLNSVTPPATPQCIASSRLISVNVTTVSGSITVVNLGYTINGVAQANIPMTNTTGTTWEATLPLPTPTNATIAWSVSATNTLGLNSSYTGTTYADEPLFGMTASASASTTTVCSGSPSSLSAILFSSAPAPGYIAPPAVTNPTIDEDLGNITITQGAATILNNTTVRNSLIGTIGTATGTTGSYSNFTSFGPYALNAGQSYNFSVSSLQDVTAYGNAMAIYIDYNRNGVFTDAGELVYTSPSTIPGAHTRTGSFAVPVGASPGLTRMRVISNEGLVTSPTMIVGYGEYEEYAINLLPSITSVTWNPGAISGNPAIVNPITTTTYTATITAAGCVYSPAPTVMVNVNPLPTAVTATNSAQCGTQVPAASVTSTTAQITPTFNWYSAVTAGTLLQTSTSTTYTSNVASTTTFYVSEVDGVTLCESTRTAVTVTVAAADGISANASSSTICIGTSVTLTAANTNPSPNQSYTYTWSGLANSGAETPVNGASVSITPLQPGSYTYDLVGVDGGCSAFAQVSITVNPFVASITAINATCNGIADGSFSLASSSCGTLPYTYSVDGGLFGSIPTNLAAGSYTVVVMGFNGYLSANLPLTITQPSTTITNPTVTAVSVCQNDLSAMLSATATTSLPTAGSQIVSFNVVGQPIETNAAPGNLVSSATFTLPANATITGGTLNYNGLTTLGGSWMSDIRLGLSGNITNAAAQGTGSTNTGGTFNYTRAIPVGAFGATNGTVDLLYWDDFNDNAGADATFPTGASAATLTINYTVPTPATISWWNASTNGAQVGTGSPFETVGTSVLPNTNTPGVYTFYAQGQNGACPSPGRTAVNVTVKANSSSSITAAACNSITINSQTYTSTGIYTQTFVNAVGCDSIITLNLTINNNTASLTTLTACDTYLWTNGTTYTSTGVYNQTLTNSVGCDSIAILNLTINNSNTGIDVLAACNSYTWIDGLTYTASNNTATFTLTNAAGCDSVVTLNLTISYPNTGTDPQIGCGSFTWIDGITYTSNNNTATFLLTNVGGCDSLVTLDLTMGFPNTGSDVQTACDSYTWIDGVTYTSNNNTATFTLINASGCDSIVSLSLTINNSTTSTTTVAACGTYTWTNGTTYTTSNTYTQLLTNGAGCDSTATLILTINSFPVATATDNGNATITASAGTLYEWINCTTLVTLPGQTAQTLTVTVNGSYKVVVFNAAGCSDTSDCIVINYIAIKEIAADHINVFPNPTRDFVTINMTSASATIEVIDAQGKLLQITQVENGGTINLSDYVTGIYMFRIKTDNGTTIHRISKN